MSWKRQRLRVPRRRLPAAAVRLPLKSFLSSLREAVLQTTLSARSSGRSGPCPDAGKVNDVVAVPGGPRPWAAAPGRQEKGDGERHPSMRMAQHSMASIEHALDPQQQLLALQAAGVAAEPAAGAQHPVAGHDDRDRVGAQRVAGGARRPPAMPARAATSRRWRSRRTGSRALACSTRRPKAPWTDAGRAAGRSRVRRPAKYSSSSRRTSSRRAGPSRIRGESRSASRLEHGVEPAVEVLVGEPDQAALGARRRPARPTGVSSYGVGDVGGRRGGEAGRRPRRRRRRLGGASDAVMRSPPGEAS